MTETVDRSTAQLKKLVRRAQEASKKGDNAGVGAALTDLERALGGPSSESDESASTEQATS